MIVPSSWLLKLSRRTIIVCNTKYNDDKYNENNDWRKKYNNKYNKCFYNYDSFVNHVYHHHYRMTKTICNETDKWLNDDVN